MVEKSSVNSNCEDEREHIDEDSKENEGTAATSYFSKHSRHLPAPDTLKRAGLIQCSHSSDKSEKDEQQTCGAPPQNEGREHDGQGLMAGHEGQNMRSEIQDQYTTSQHVSLHETVACNITLDPEATIKAQTPHVPPDRNKGHNAKALMMFMPMAERKRLLQASRSVNVPKDAKPNSEDILPPQLPANLQSTPPFCHTIVNVLTGKTAPNLDPNDSSTSLSTSGQAFRKTIEEQQHITEQATHNRVAVELDKQQPTALTAFGSGSAGVVQRLRLSRSRGNSLDSKPAIKAKSAPVSTVVLTALEAAGAAFITGSSIHTAAHPDPPSRDDQSLLTAAVVAVSSTEEEKAETKTEDPSPDSALLGAGDKFKESILRPTPIIPLQGTEKLAPLLAAKGQQETAAPTTVCSIFLTPSQRRALAVSNKQAKVAASATQGVRETVDTVAELVPDSYNPQTGGVASLIRDPAPGDTAALASTSAAMASCPPLHQDHADVTTTVDEELEDRSMKDIGVDLVLVGTTSGSEKVQQSTVDLTLLVDPPAPNQPIMQSAPSTADPTQKSQIEKRSGDNAPQDPHVVSLSLLPPPHTQALQQGQDLSIEPLPLFREGSALHLTVSCSNLKDAFSSESQPHQLSVREESGCDKKRKKGGGRLSRSIRKPQAGAETVTLLMTDIVDPAGEAKSEVVPGAEVLITEDIAEVLIVAESATENTRGAQVTFVAEAQAECLSLEGDLESSTAVITLEDGVDAASTKVIVCNKEEGPSLPSKDAEGDAKIYAIPECKNIGLGPLLKPESSSSEIVTLAMETSGPAISRRLSRKRSSSASNLRTDTGKGGNNKVHLALKGSSKQAVQVEDVVEVMDNATAVPGGLHPKMTKQHPAVSTKFKMSKPQLRAGAAEMMSSAISSDPLVSTIQLPVDVPASRHDDPSSASLVVDLVCSPSSRDLSLELAELPCSSLGGLPILKAKAAVDIVIALDIMTPPAARMTDVEICSLTQNKPSTLTDSVTNIPPSKRKAAVLPMFLPMAERKRIQQVQAAAQKQKTIAVDAGAEAAIGVNTLWDQKTELEGTTVQMWQSGDPAPPLLPTALTSELGFDFNARSVEGNASSNPTSKPSAAVPAAHHTVSGEKSADSHVIVTTVNPFFMARRSFPAKPAAAASLSGSTSAGGLPSIPHLTGSAYLQALKPELPCIHVQQLDPSTTDYQYDRTSRFHDVKLPQLLGTLLSFPEASASSSTVPAAKTVSANAWTTIPLQVKGANDSLLLTAKENCGVGPLSQIQQDLAADASKCTTTVIQDLVAADASKCTTTVIQEARHALQRDSTTLGHSVGMSVAVLEQRKKLRTYIQRETDALFARGTHVLASCRFWPLDLLPSQSRPAMQGGIIDATADHKSRGGALAVKVNPKSCVSEENNLLLRQLSLQLAVMEKNSSNYAVVGTYDDSDQQLLDVVTPDEVYNQLQNQLVGMKTSAGANVISAYLKANHHSFSGLKEDNCISSIRDAPLGDRQVVTDPARRLISILPWPVKYQPRRAADMCGNGEGVQQLRSWLMAWLNKINGIQGVSELHPQEGSLPSWEISGDNGSWLAGDDDEDEEGGGRTGRMMSSRGGINAIALTGPPGCGKTAAVTACALELGLDVIEVNASSDERTGADLLRLIGEATQSRRLAHMVMEQQQQATSRAQQKNYWGPQSKLSSHGTDELEGKKKNKQRAKRKVISDDDSEAPCNADTVIRKKTAASKSAGQPALEKSTKGGSYKEAAQVGLKPFSLEEETSQQHQRGCLILFEGIDLLHDADRGFLAALSEIIEESKRPLVLTMNSPHLPAPLEGKGITVLPFKPPCETELLRLVALVSAAEGVGHQASSEILDSRVSTEEGEPTAGYALSTDFLPQTARLVRACNGDIRAALMTSQFWWSTVKGTTALGITRVDQLLADITQHTPPCPFKLCCSDAAVWASKIDNKVGLDHDLSRTQNTSLVAPMQQFTAALTPERDAVQAYRHACAEGTMQAVRDLDLWLLATVDALCAASYTDLSSETTAVVPEPRDCAGLRPEHLNNECSVRSVKMTEAHQGEQEEAAGMVMHSEDADVQLTGKQASFSTLVSTDLGMNSNSSLDPTASSSYGSLNAGSIKRQEELAAYHAACSDVHASMLARGWSAHHAERISQAREQRRARSKASSSKRKSKKGVEDDPDIMMPELDDSAAPPMTSRSVTPGLEVAPPSGNHCVEDDTAGDIRHPGATETKEAIIHPEPLTTKGVDAMEAIHSEPHTTAEDAILSAACLAGSDMPIASPLVRSPTCMDGVIDSPPDIRVPVETKRGFTTNAMAGPHGKLRSSAAEVRQLLALIPSTDQKVKGITDGVMPPQLEGPVEAGRAAGPDSDGDGSVGGDGSMGGDGLVGNGTYFTDKSRGEISHPDGLPPHLLQQALSHGVPTNQTDAGPLGSNHNNGLAEDERPCFRLSDHQKQVQQLLSSDMVSLQDRPSLPLFPPEPPLLLRPGTTCLRPEAAVSQEANRACSVTAHGHANRACSVTAHGHASWSQQQQQAFTALRVLSRCHELLSQCCVLAASRDPLPVSSGPAPLPHHAMQLASFPMLPGRNTAVFASSFMVVGTPPCRPLVTADAMREEDGSCPAACMEEMIQEELKQGSRQALPGCGSEELYASGSSSSSRGLSLGQQAAGEVASLLLNHVKQSGCRVGSCGSFLLPEVKEQEEASTTSTDLYDMSYLQRSSVVYPGQVMNCISCDNYQRLSQMNEVLISAHPRAAMLSCQASAQYLGSLRGMCHSEALRQEDAMRCAGRGRRVPRFKHYVQETCPDVSEESVIALLSSCKFGTV